MIFIDPSQYVSLYSIQIHIIDPPAFYTLNTEMNIHINIIITDIIG